VKVHTFRNSYPKEYWIVIHEERGIVEDTVRQEGLTTGHPDVSGTGHWSNPCSLW